MRQLATIGSLALGLCLVGCGSSSTPGNGNGATPTATIVGAFRIEGGPAPGINRPLDGQITIHAGTTTGHVVATVTAVSGHFRATVPPGRYVAVGKSDGESGIPCTGSATALAGHTSHVTVTCDVP
jgi:hypothetical protein